MLQGNPLSKKKSQGLENKEYFRECLRWGPIEAAAREDLDLVCVQANGDLWRDNIRRWGVR